MINITLGEIITLIAVVLSFIAQYITFSNRFSKFEGYTKAKLESFEKDLTNLWEIVRDLKRI